jgi:hypothetical protein
MHREVLPYVAAVEAAFSPACTVFRQQHRSHMASFMTSNQHHHACCSTDQDMLYVKAHAIQLRASFLIIIALALPFALFTAHRHEAEVLYDLFLALGVQPQQLLPLELDSRHCGGNASCSKQLVDKLGLPVKNVLVIQVRWFCTCI